MFAGLTPVSNVDNDITYNLTNIGVIKQLTLVPRPFLYFLPYNPNYTSKTLFDMVYNHVLIQYWL